MMHRCMSAFVLCEICNSFREGQQVCLNSGLHKTINQLITQPDVLASSMLKRWVSLCLGKLCEDFVLAKYMFMSEVGHLQFHQLLVDPCPLVRAAVVSSLGELFGASQGNLTQGINSTATPTYHGNSSALPMKQNSGLGSGMGMPPPLSADNYPFGMTRLPSPGIIGTNSSGRMPPPVPLTALRSMGSLGAQGTTSNPDCQNPSPGSPLKATHINRAAVEQLELRRSELQLALHILDRLNDGSAMVRREAVIALSKFFLVPIHWPCIKLVVRFVIGYHSRLLKNGTMTVQSKSPEELSSTGSIIINLLQCRPCSHPVSFFRRNQATRGYSSDSNGHRKVTKYSGRSTE